MRDIKELKDFIFEKAKYETTGDPEQLTWDSIYTDWVDSLGIQIILMDIEEEFCEPGFMIEEEFIFEFFAKKPTIQQFADVITDLLLGNIDLVEATKSESYVYVKQHDW